MIASENTNVTSLIRPNSGTYVRPNKKVFRVTGLKEGVDRGGGGTGIEGAESGVEGAESGVEGAGSGSRGAGRGAIEGGGLEKLEGEIAFLY